MSESNEKPARPTGRVPPSGVGGLSEHEARSREQFERVKEYVLEKNRELYERLARGPSE